MIDPVSLAVVGCTIVATAYFGFRAVDRAAQVPAEIGKSVQDTAKTIVEELQRLFGATPKTVVDRVVIQKAPEKICELYFAKQLIGMEAEIVNTWLKSTKRLRVSQGFEVRAGFDLNRLKFEFDSKGKTVNVVITESTIINIQAQQDFKWLQKEEGWWNKSNTDDDAALVNKLIEQARNRAESGELEVVAMAELQLAGVLRRVVEAKGLRMKLVKADSSILVEGETTMQPVPDRALKSLGMVFSAIDH